MEIEDILLDGQNVDMSDFREYLSDRAAGGEIQALQSGVEGVTAHTYLRPGFDEKVVVGMLGGPEANFAINFDYDGATHRLFDTGSNAWSFTLGCAGGVTLQFIPAGSNTPTSPDIWQRTGRVPWHVDENGHMITGRGISDTASDWVSGSALEMEEPGTGIWGANKTVTMMSNYYYDGADRFADAGRAGSLSIGNGALRYTSSSISGLAGGDAATMVDRFGISNAGVMTLAGATVTYGANDSGGTGFKVLRVPN